jgi:hypothetical protein
LAERSGVGRVLVSREADSFRAGRCAMRRACARLPGTVANTDWRALNQVRPAGRAPGPVSRTRIVLRVAHGDP